MDLKIPITPKVVVDYIESHLEFEYQKQFFEGMLNYLQAKKNSELDPVGEHYIGDENGLSRVVKTDKVKGE